MQDATELLTLSQMARQLHVPVKWLREQAEAGNIPNLNAGGRFLFNAEAVKHTLIDRARQSTPRLAHAA